MTRLYNNVVSSRLIRIKNKTQYLRQNLLNMLCIFLIGFLSGNLFGTILNNLRNWVRWDGFIIFGLIAKIEAISYFLYKSTEAKLCVTFGEATNVFDGRTNLQIKDLYTFGRNLSGIKRNPKKLKNHFVLPFFCINPTTRFHSNPFEKKRLLRQKSYKFGHAFWNNLNLFKIGIMVGFFVDAFKVGS